MTDNPDQQVKYQKLAAEYSKVRAQNQVLKKAVLEEQEKSTKHAELLQSLRRAEQENDSLNFRNQQLTCRLTLLQEDLQQLQTKGYRRHSGHHRSSSSGGAGMGGAVGDNVDVAVLMQELQAKISENASLHARVEELERAGPQQEAAQGLAQLQEHNADLTARLRKSTEALALHERAAKKQLEEVEAQRTAASATIAQLNRHVHALKLQVVRAAADAADDPSSSSSSSSYLSLAPIQQSEAASKGTLSPFSPLEGAKDATGGRTPSTALDSKDTLGAVDSDSAPSLTFLSKDICDKFAAFVKALCEVQLTHVLEEDLKAKEAIVKAQQGVLYWERLGPLLEEVFRRLEQPSEGAVPIAGSMSATTASTVAQLRIVSTLPPPGAAQAALRAVQSSWSAALPYLSALSANSSRSHSGSTLHRLLGLLADRCSALHTALDSAHTQWAAQERDEQDDIVTLALLDLVRATDRFVTAIRRRLEAGVERQPGTGLGQSQISVHNSSLGQSQNILGMQTGRERKPPFLELEPSLHGSTKPSQNCLTGLGQATNGLSFRLGKDQNQEMGLGRDSIPTPTSPTSLSSQEDSNISNISVNISTNSGNNSSCSGNADRSGNPSDYGTQSGNVLKSNDLHSERDNLSCGGTSGNAADLRGKENGSEKSGKLSEAASARLAQLHRQREHWRLEYHLLSHKHAKLMRLLKDTDASGIKALSSGAVKVNPTSIIGEVTVTHDGVGSVATLLEEQKDSRKKGQTLGGSAEDEESWRESMIRHHLTARCSKLFLELTKACSKAALLQEEAEAAVSRASEAEAVAGALENELERVRGERAKLSEELRTTCLNYEQQMAAMADHLAGLNEKITEQEDRKAFPRTQKKNKK